jgi:hypothetical protein
MKRGEEKDYNNKMLCVTKYVGTAASYGRGAPLASNEVI